MNLRVLVVVVALPALLAAEALGQGTFQNLGFEAARNIPAFDPQGHPWTMSAADALPGWSVYLGNNQVATAWYNDVSIGAAAISLQGPGSLQPVLQGSYTVLLQPNFPSGQIVPAIAQVGTIPNAAQSLTFYGFGTLTVSIAGQPVPLTVLGSTPAYSIYGGNVSAFAGQTGELRFSGSGYLDNIQFSNLPVPEPSVIGLCGLGAGLLGWCWRKRTRA